MADFLNAVLQSITKNKRIEIASQIKTAQISQQLRSEYGYHAIMNSRSIHFKNKTNPATSGKKIIAEEIIEVIKDETFLKPKPAKQAKTNYSSIANANVKPSLISNETQQKSKMFNNLVKRKQALLVVTSKTNECTKSSISSEVKSCDNRSTAITSKSKSGGGLSMLAAYSDSSEESE